MKRQRGMHGVCMKYILNVDEYFGMDLYVQRIALCIPDTSPVVRHEN